MPEAVIEFRNVSYRLADGREIVRDLTLEVSRGEILVLLGRSGSGKTTALKLVNRLLEISSGELQVEGRAVTHWDVIDLRRHIGYAIQDVGLFPHYTVAQNVGLLPSIQNWSKEKIDARVHELLTLTGLPLEIANRYPHQLSGGQRQRVGVARALAADPPILLMDEPFGALDPLTRSDLQREFLSLQQKLQKTVLFVTHDLHEALFLGARIALLDEGALVSLNIPQSFLNSSDPLVKSYVEAFGSIDTLRGYK
ncbi:MAG TPA: ATP-binding cassette domain-containing protein [Terriglobales bacterium]|nr:ATP-binding cassette domain-containing protein [Terriglobales bacterium]